MKRVRFKFIPLVLLLCLIPNVAVADDSEVQASVTVVHNQITDLAVSNPNYTSLTLTWTSPPGSDNWKEAVQYDIRYSPSPITTDPEWNAATQLADPPIPQPPGTPETLLVIGLNQCATYCFAIKAADSKGTWTPLSNSPQGTTACFPADSGGGIGLAPSPNACPVTLSTDMQGNITTTSMTNDGVLCAACLARDMSGKNTLELDKGTKVMLAGNIVPLLLKVQTTTTALPTTENTVVISPVYAFDAYASSSGTTPSPVSISPPARLILSYDANSLPENTTEVFIANYDTKQGWLALAPVPGAVAEIGKAHGLLSHFSLYAVLARTEASSQANFEVSNLTVSPSKTEIGQIVTVSVNVSNNGEEKGDYSLDLAVDGAVKSSTRVTVAAGSSETVNLTLTADSVGKHQVEVAGLFGKFEVKSAQTSNINWWLIGSITGIVIVVVIWSILGWMWFRGRKKTI